MPSVVRGSFVVKFFTAFRPSGVPEVRCPHYSLSDPTVTTGCSRCLPSWAGPRGFGRADSALSFAALARHCNKEAGSHVPGEDLFESDCYDMGVARCPVPNCGS